MKTYAPNELAALWVNHQTWLASKGKLGSRLHFEDADLSGQDFSELNLSYSTWINCNLKDTVFTESNLSGAVFFDCNLQQAFTGHVDFTGALLRMKYEDNEKSEAVATFEHVIKLLVEREWTFEVGNTGTADDSVPFGTWLIDKYGRDIVDAQKRYVYVMINNTEYVVFDDDLEKLNELVYEIEDVLT